MRPNPKCIKAILLFVQDNTTPSYPYVSLDDILENLTDFSRDQIVDTLENLRYECIFTVFAVDDFYQVGTFGDLTPQGHTVAEKMRNDTLWNKVLSSGINAIPEILSFILSA